MPKDRKLPLYEEEDHDDEVLFGAETFDFQRPQHDFYKPGSADPVVLDWGPSLTRQEFAAECDINTIMERYETTGTINHVARTEPLYLDYTAVPRDLASAMDFMRGASQEFMRLPAHVRREFDNDPKLFVDYAADPKNVDRMREWDLAKKPQEAPSPIRVEVSNLPAPTLPPAS
jgi:hypothetical protein